MHFVFFRKHPKVKRLDMLHAADYANMAIDQMSQKMDSAKKMDKNVQKAIE